MKSSSVMRKNPSYTCTHVMVKDVYPVISICNVIQTWNTSTEAILHVDTCQKRKKKEISGGRRNKGVASLFVTSCGLEQGFASFSYTFQRHMVALKTWPSTWVCRCFWNRGLATYGDLEKKRVWGEHEGMVVPYSISC